MIWMEHPKHGHKPCLPIEVESAKANGWVECGPPPWNKVQEPPKRPVLTLKEKHG